MSDRRTLSQRVAWDPELFAGYSAGHLELIEYGFKTALSQVYGLEQAERAKRRKPKPQPNAEQLAALRSFAARSGRYWKQGLRDMWWDGSDARQPEGPLLRQIRNEFGPQWLERFRLDPE